MTTKPVYVVCVFNVYCNEAARPEESPEEILKRKRTFHYFGYTPESAEDQAEATFHRSCDHNWWPPVLLGEFPIAIKDGQELVEGDLTCPHCGIAL
jgi:hypothetical protein